MVKLGKSNRIGGWAFLIGVVLAIVLGLLGSYSVAWLLFSVVIGLVVGLLNVTDQETHPFLTSGIILIIASWLGQDVLSGAPLLNNILQNLLAIFVPATIIVAIRNVFTIARR